MQQPRRGDPILLRDDIFRDFPALRNDADPDIPILKQAQAECARLQ
jgi:hypothetical protein